MEHKYPQEVLGATLLEVRQFGEYRRVFVRERPSDVEIGELSYGPLTEEVYEMPAHYHAMYVRATTWEGGGAGLEAYLRRFFAEDECYCLGDLMDEFDRSAIGYGYMDAHADGRLTYRHARHGRGARPDLRLVAT